MPVTAQYLDPDHIQYSRSDMPGKAITASLNNRDHRKTLAEGIVVQDWTMTPTEEDVVAERNRRLRAGFDYNFGDARGVHSFATTESDMRGWDEVTKGATAAVLGGAPTTQFQISTETGDVTVTAAEWQGILVAATLNRQPIWLGSFALAAMDPIPADYASNDSYWDGS
jgi:hypothetical protein